ncbi:MAG: HEPN domain-containing protein [bacterium]|nr:HEPN domain-containing protein [bacterium]
MDLQPKKSEQSKNKDELLKKVLESFHKFAKSAIKIKEQDSSTTKDSKGNIHLHLSDLELFYNKQKDPLKSFIPHKDLENLSKLLEPDYEFLEKRDIYFALSHIFYKIFSYLFWDEKNINIDYQTTSNSFGFCSWVNFTPKNKKPKAFEELYQDQSLGFTKEVIETTLSDINAKYNNQHLEFELKFNCQFHNLDEDIKIDDRLEIAIKNKILTIKGKYSGNPNKAGYHLQNDLYGILSILEMEGVLLIKDAEKRIGSSILSKGIICENKEIEFTHKKNKEGGNDSFDIMLHYFREYLKKFDERGIGYIPIHLFALLSKQFAGDVITIIPNFFSSENFRFPRTEFFNYWSALEILLGNPKENIRESLVKAYELFYPEEKKLEDKKNDPQKTISKLWKIRNDIVHNGKIHVDSQIIWDIKSKVKSLFHKILLTRISDKSYFSIKLSVDKQEYK